MIHSIIAYSVKNKFIVALLVAALIGWGAYSISVIPVGAVPDVTNNQVQILTTTRNLATEEVEQFITYPVELAMANLPGVVEIRSVSKFGLSVVTVVFEESMGTYLPRQLIEEKLKMAKESIPAQFGSPEMGPISTGLGEIYQYVLDVDPAYRDRYSTMDLRTIQDWIVKRQLSGIEGVVEVNTWGGFLKQYEVALDPAKMMAMDVSITEVFSALEANNDITGGGYIEKSDETFFIRGDGLTRSLEELGATVVKRTGGVPVLVRDVAELRFGHATRFGAVTGNGEGEKVMGQIMMLKDANSNRVIENVKARVEEIGKSLPEGVRINPFLERTELIKKTTATVEENLILGALIVVFVIVLLLGHPRSALIVATVIPLSLMFGISMMNVFGLSANLMSLGAIDFGIIIDGAVIIVEFILFRFSGLAKGADGSSTLTTEQRDEITIDSASKVMQPAIFGQIIIFIVFIPILALSGVEGKMFKPMALSFSFTLLGAMILCLTYVPMMSAWLFTRIPSDGSIMKRLSHSLMKVIYSWYRPTLEFVVRHARMVLVLSLVMLGGAVFLFSRMGGEFVPTLDEGDFVVQPVLKTGTSLSATVDIMTKLENILLEQFPEVEQVVTRIGAGEVPTDPMSMEEADVIIKLKPRDEWVTADSKEELANKIKEALSVVPGVDFEFTQPIEMRFNELITGVRSDVAVKIYGENLDTLYQYAQKAEGLISGVPGAADIIVEKTDNLPQINVNYNRARLAQLGLSTRELNRVIRTAFGGEKMGVVYEGERRFDVAVRYQAPYRQSLEAMQNMYVDTPSGQRIPLREVANVSYRSGPAKISRDDTKRRIVIGVNVRDRDMESVVQDIQSILDTQLSLPDGYHITYGGQFENMRNAVKRLKIAVPVSLTLILIMLFFAFQSWRQAFLVFSAIPLAAIGGVVALYLRGMPFSISAGVGFIALFGIAVLNGIVLIEFFNHLKEEGMHDVLERVREGTKQRLRPVLLTASAAALGFLPMALSGSAGAEVQRPLATVVIGGLISSTLLTLVVLPLLYMRFGEPRPASGMNAKGGAKWVAVLMLAILSISAQAQSEKVDLDRALEMAKQNNPSYQAAALDVARSKALEKTAWDVGKTTLFYGFDENNIAPNGFPLRVYGVAQSIPFPTVMGTQKSVAVRMTEVSRQQHRLAEVQLERDVTLAFDKWQYLHAKYREIRQLDSLFQLSANAVKRRVDLGTTNELEWLNAKAHSARLSQFLQEVASQIAQQRQTLTRLLNSPDSLQFDDAGFTKWELAVDNPDMAVQSNAGLATEEETLRLRERERQLEQGRRLPDLHLQYFVGVGMNANAQNFNGYQLGISLPLFSRAQSGRAQAARVVYEMQRHRVHAYQQALSTTYGQHFSALNAAAEKLRFYEAEGLGMSERMLQMAQVQYHSGESSFDAFIRTIENAQNIKIAYLDILHDYNQLVISINHLIIENK